MAALRSGISAAGPTGTDRPAARAGACARRGASRSSSVSNNFRRGVTTVLAFRPSGVGCHGAPHLLGLEPAKNNFTINRRLVNSTGLDMANIFEKKYY